MTIVYAPAGWSLAAAIACGQISGDLDLALSGQAAINERMQVGLGDRGNGRWRTVGIHGLLLNTFI
ncbi:hypothetical protein LJR118_002512 [Acidovorax sp. LjRoot118]|uniref:hypothetical protein n=1 Tax=Acidovorax sp. LjRoot118 TaxID=3342256 RepID=UPI003ED01B50